jgi:hypothetical protein
MRYFPLVSQKDRHKIIWIFNVDDRRIYFFVRTLPFIYFRMMFLIQILFIISFDAENWIIKWKTWYSCSLDSLYNIKFFFFRFSFKFLKFKKSLLFNWNLVWNKCIITHTVRKICSCHFHIFHCWCCLLRILFILFYFIFRNVKMH